MKVEVIKFEGFDIKVAELKDGFRYATYKEGTTNQYFKNHNYFKTKEEALNYAKSKISEHNKKTIQKRVNGIPTADEFVEAINSVKPTDGQWAMLKAHYNAPDRKLTSAQLAKAANYEHFYAANTQYGTLGSNISSFLNFIPPGKYDNGGPLWITAITKESHHNLDEDTGHFQHILRDEVAEALEIIGLV